MNIYLSTAYLAPIQYYCLFQDNNQIFIEQQENYIKQSYRNRCVIMAANGAMPLSIPVEHSGKDKLKTKDIRIASHGNWQHLHWNAIMSAYNSSPFYEYYADDFAPFYHKKYNFLFDFNVELNRLILTLLNIDDFHLYFTTDYKTDFSEQEIDLRESIHPKRGSNLNFFTSVEYYQVFASKFSFTGNMSIIDLLFNAGNESLLVLRDSYLGFQNKKTDY